MAWAMELVNRVHISFMVAGHTDHLLPLYGGGGLSVVKSTYWTAQVMTKVLEQCFRGQWKGSLLHTVDPTVLGTPSRDYKDHYACTQIKDKKFANMVTMYDKFISSYLTGCDQQWDYNTTLQDEHERWLQKEDTFEQRQ